MRRSDSLTIDNVALHFMNIHEWLGARHANGREAGARPWSSQKSAISP